MSTICYEKSCRICLQNNGFINIFHGTNKNENFLPPIDLINKLISSLQIQMYLDDGLPDTICLKCYGLLHTFDDFLTTMEASNNILKNYFKIEDDTNLIIEKLDEDENIFTDEDDESNCVKEKFVNQNSISSYDIKTDADADNSNCAISNNDLIRAENIDFEMIDSEFCNNSYEYAENSEQFNSNEVLCEICAKSFDTESKYNEHVVNGSCENNFFNSNNRNSFIEENIEINSSSNQSAANEQINSNTSIDINKFVNNDDENLYEVHLYKCGICFQNFNQLDDLENHLTTIHTKASSKSSRLRSNRYVRYVCEICKECFKSNYRLWTHRKAKHEVKNKQSNVNEKYKCPFCPRTFSLLETLKQHSNLHSKLPIEESKHICLECNITFKRADHLKMHHNGFHLKKFSFHCSHEFCKKSFITNWARNKHYKMDHSIEKNIFICDTCPKQYKSSSALRRHEKTHRELSGIQCNICKNYFARSDILKEHLKSHNIDEKTKQELIVETYDLIKKSQNKNFLNP